MQETLADTQAKKKHVSGPTDQVNECIFVNFEMYFIAIFLSAYILAH